MTTITAKVVATAPALELIERLSAIHGRLMFVQPYLGADGESPVCLPEGELMLGSNDLLLAEIGGAPFYIDAGEYAAWDEPQLEVDVAAGPTEGFSLESLEGGHFVTRRVASPRWWTQ